MEECGRVGCGAEERRRRAQSDQRTVNAPRREPSGVRKMPCRILSVKGSLRSGTSVSTPYSSMYSRHMHKQRLEPWCVEVSTVSTVSTEYPLDTPSPASSTSPHPINTVSL